MSTSTVAVGVALALVFSHIATLFVASAAGLGCDAPEQGPDLRVLHVNSPCSPLRPKTMPLSWADSVLQMQSNDRARLQYLTSLVAGRSIVPIASGRAITQNPTYIVRAKIGTPAQTLLVAIDTSNDAAWFPCAGCLGCSSATYNPSKSTTFKPVACGAPQCSQVTAPSCSGTTCGFNRTYGSSSVAADLVQDNITLATDLIPAYTFGCVRGTTGNSFPAQGLLGLGRGPLSLLSQTTQLYNSIFSYCLPSYKSPNFAGSLRLGPNSQPKTIKTTPLLKNPRRSSLYYVNLLAIRVGRRVVNIPPSAFAFDPTTGAGTVFDSGTVFTSLVKPAYVAVRDEFRRRMNATVSTLGGFDTCYNVPINVPTITFMFSGMNFTLPQDNFIIRSSAGNTACLAMAAAPDSGVNSVLNVIASFQQQNHRVLVDGPNSRLGVAREQCS
ncbi:eukaryotic aspartyl protease family protein [Striga asiatica]|uniref:Eukaryotic aspartyl protease family protein n=1 Tax=Striga asiatica TaxID=4170 RepID=A0A5A7P7J3_STRAF|nr:eukaryotic aspartyl protease family protein [Striga asiatica]